MKLQVIDRGDEDDRQFAIANADYRDYDNMSWDDYYVSFSGYFGSIGPHVFVAAPELLEALKELVADAEEAINVPASAYAAIRKAEGK